MPKKFDGRRIAVARMAGIDREEVGRELGFLEAVRDHVRMRKRDFDPGLQRLRRRVADREVQLGRARAAGAGARASPD